MAQLAQATMPFLNALADLRLPWLTAFFNALTYLGDEKLFVVISMIVLWCFSKRGGLYMLTVGFGVSNVGQALKMIFRIPRPWNLGSKPFDRADPIARGSATNATGEATGLGKLIGKLLGAGADGWSFPSGHTLISVGTYGAMAAWFSQRWVRIAGIVLAVLVPFSRLYLGVHTPLDILGGAVIALIAVLALRPIFASDGTGKIRGVLIGNIVLSAVLLVLMYLNNPQGLAGEDIGNYCSGIKNLWQLLGATMAVEIAFEVDEKWLHYDTRAIWWAQLLKIAGGCVIVLALQMGIQKALGYSSDALTMANVTRMGIIACVANFVAMTAGAALWPMTFKKFRTMGGYLGGKHAKI